MGKHDRIIAGIIIIFIMYIMDHIVDSAMASASPKPFDR